MACESTELLLVKQFPVKAALLVKGQDIKCHSYDATWLSLNELNDGFGRAHSLPRELRERVRLRIFQHPVESGDIQTIDAIRLVNY